VDEDKRTVSYQITSSTFPNWQGVSQTRTIEALSADAFKTTNPSVAGGPGSAFDLYKRAK